MQAWMRDTVLGHFPEANEIEGDDFLMPRGDFIIQSDYGMNAFVLARATGSDAAWERAAQRIIAGEISVPGEKRGECSKCHRPNRKLYNTGTVAHPYFICGTCQRREERRINTREMWGGGRPGY